MMVEFIVVTALIALIALAFPVLGAIMLGVYFTATIVLLVYRIFAN